MKRRYSVIVAVLCLAGPRVTTAAVLHVSQTGNDANDGLSWATAKRTVQAGLDSAVAGDEVRVAAGTYPERITLKAGVALYGGFAGTETELSQRDWPANETILDGQALGRVVTSPSGAASSTGIDGFTIRNGNAGSGGGTYCTSSSPTIVNTIVAFNSSGISQEISYSGTPSRCRSTWPVGRDSSTFPGCPTPALARRRSWTWGRTNI